MKQQDHIISRFSSHLFWDVDQNKVTIEKNLPFMVQRVLEYGKIEDWILLRNAIGIKALTEVAMQLKSLDDISLNFVSTLSGVPKEQFRCFKGSSSKVKACLPAKAG